MLEVTNIYMQYPFLNKDSGMFYHLRMHLAVALLSRFLHLQGLSEEHKDQLRKKFDIAHFVAKLNKISIN